MRPDQIERLADLQERLLDVFLNEADPENWSGAGKVGAKMSQQERGDRHWDKKSAASTMVVLSGVDRLILNTKEALGRDPFDDAGMDAQIAKAEAEARKRADAVISTASRKAVHDKAPD
jgi:hypothetical protein